MQVSAEGIVIGTLPTTCLSVDVAFDSHRVWTVELRKLAEPTPGIVQWPSPLTPLLIGTTTVTVTDSASGDEFFRDEVQFSADSARTQITNGHGTHLAINKWGDLAPDLAELSPLTLERLLSSTESLIEKLQDLGYRPFVVGGTLLGAVREGKLLPHDDDADIAFLSQHTNPVDVAAESFALGHELKSLGYEFARHSAAHIQLFFRDTNGIVEYHIDIFSAFFTDDGNINQPFHVRGPFGVNQMLPFSTVKIDGVEFPAPADPESWLVINYDENWRTPIPGYRLMTPEATVRRFDNWFGGFNFRREFWSHWFEEVDDRTNSWVTGKDWIASQDFKSATVLDLGCGAGDLAQQLAVDHPAMRVIGVDYSPAALSRARESVLATNVQFRHLNLNRLESLGIVVDASITGPFDVTANNLLEQIDHQARQNVLRIARMALRGGGSAYATSYAMHAPDVNPQDPTGWHLDQTTLRLEALELGLEVSFFSLSPTSAQERKRKPYGVSFSLVPSHSVSRPLAIGRRIMLNRLKSFIRRSSKSILHTEIEQLREQVSALEQELDEYRRHSLHVAEMLDLVEQRITSQIPGAPTE